MSQKLEVKKEKGKIFSFIRNKWLELQPEEEVRQKFVAKLVNEYGYSLEQMAEEIKLSTSQRGTGRASADLVVWKTKEDKQNNKTAFLVCEFKAKTLRLKPEDCYQGYNYATWSRAKLFAISNGEELQVYKVIEDELPLNLQPVNDIPKADEILDEKKLEDFLLKTKEFTGNEFASVLRKCHNIIRNNDKLSPEAAFDEISKILFIKIMYERNPKQEAKFSLKQFKKLKEAWELTRGDSDEETSYMQKLFNDVKKHFKSDELFDPNEKINLKENSFEQIVKELEIYNLTATSSDVKGIAFEKFLGKTLRGELGQFFTPRTIVDFMVEILEPKEGELICDPACGSGGFLINAFEKIRSQIEQEFILRKKEKQKEIFGENLENIEDKELNKKYEEELEKINEEYEERIKNLSHKSIFGTDANPRMARVAKMNMIMHGDGHNGIHHNDGLLNTNGIKENKFDVILANPPFGSRVPKDLKVGEHDTTDKEIIGEKLVNLYDVGKFSTLTEVLFMERNLRLLKPGGRMGIVLPEGVLNNSNLQKVRDYFEGKAKLILITSIPQDVFIASGATVKPSLVFMKKFTLEEEKEYNEIKEQATKEINEKYQEDLENLEKEIKQTKDKEEKKKLKKSLKELQEKIKSEIKKQIKEKFNYTIPIAEVEKAGISTTGAVIENELEPLAKEFKEYRKKVKLWEEK